MFSRPVKTAPPKGGPAPSVGPSGALAPRPQGIDWVSASEVGSWCYCAKMYWLGKVQHERPDPVGQARLKAGMGHHADHGRKYDAQLRLRQWAMASLATTMVLAFLAWLYLRIVALRS